jgi:hypothetical protein
MNSPALKRWIAFLNACHKEKQIKKSFFTMGVSAKEQCLAGALLLNQ